MGQPVPRPPRNPRFYRPLKYEPVRPDTPSLSSSLLVAALGLLALWLLSGCATICRIQPDLCEPTPAPTPTPTPPVPPPPPEPDPDPTPACPEYLDGVGLELSEPQVNAFAPIVNGVMADLTGCSIGSDCRLGDETRQEFQARVFRALRERGHCAGQHERTTDEIFVGPSIDGRLEGYHVFAGDGSPGPLPPGGTKRKVVWAPGANRPTWRVAGPLPEPPPPDPDPTVCADPDPRGRPARFVLKRIGNGNKITSTYQVSERAYCDQVCSPIEPDVCFTGRNHCPVRMEGDPERVLCERDPEVIGDQKWWCAGRPLEPTDNPAQARCSGTARTCTENGATCAEMPPRAP